MEISSLANRTDLAMLERSGSEISDRGTHLVVRTPDNPTFWWGNFLLLAEAPADEERAAEWLREFEREFPRGQAPRHRHGRDGRQPSRTSLPSRRSVWRPRSRA